MLVKMELKHRSVDLVFIKKIRLENHFTMARTARSIGLKGTEKYLRRENGEYNFKPEELSLLSELWGVPMEKFFTSNLPKSQVKKERG